MVQITRTAHVPVRRLAPKKGISCKQFIS